MSRRIPPSAEATPVDRLAAALRALDPQGDLQAFLVGVAREILAVTGARACGVTRRFRGAARDLGLLIDADGRVARKAVFLDQEERDRELPASHEQTERKTFSGKVIRDLARLSKRVPERVWVIPVHYHGRPVVTLELADPTAEVAVADLGRVLADLAPAFQVAVLHDRLRRERLEAQMLREVGQELGRTLDLQDLLTELLDLLRKVVPYDAAAIYVLDEAGLSAVHHSLRGYEEGQEAIVELKLDQGIVGWAARKGASEIVPDVRKDERYLEARPRTRAEMVVPLKSGGKVIGVFNLESDRASAYNPHDMELLETFAGQAAAALERARLLENEKEKERLDQELRIARRIQKSFRPPETETLRRRRLVGRTLPSEEVSGDYYDFLERPDGSVAVALADVSGKGIPAALIMSSLRAAFRLEAAVGEDAAALCGELNTSLYWGTRDTEFATGVFGILNPDQTRFRYCNAGHNAPLLVRAGGELEWLEAGGLMLGAFPGATYEDAEVELAPGDLLVMYTDGVTEAHPGDHDDFGTERLVTLLTGLTDRAPARVCRAIIRAVRDYAQGPLPDDLTLVVLEGGPHE